MGLRREESGVSEGTLLIMLPAYRYLKFGHFQMLHNRPPEIRRRHDRSSCRIKEQCCKGPCPLWVKSGHIAMLEALSALPPKSGHVQCNSV